MYFFHMLFVPLTSVIGFQVIVSFSSPIYVNASLKTIKKKEHKPCNLFCI